MILSDRGAGARFGRSICGLAAAVALVLLGSQSGLAQPWRGGRGDDSHRDDDRHSRGGPPMMRGGGPPMMGGGPPMMRGGGPPSMGGGSPADRVAGMLRMADTNGDGKIDLNEIPEYRRGFVKMMLDRMGLDASKPLAIETIQEKVTEQMGGGARSDEDDSPPSEGEDQPENQTPLVPGFGVEREAPPAVPAFGVRVDAVNPFVAGAASAGRADDRSSAAARGMIARYDRNRNGVIDRDEMRGMRGDPREIDRNRDGRITVDEMARRMRDHESSPDSHSRRDDSGDEDSRTSYRFRTTLELLPEGLPAWFVPTDKNGDGQISMAEFSGDWDDELVEHFNFWDFNLDGIVTARECVDADREAEAAGYIIRHPDVPEQGESAEERTADDLHVAGDGPPPGPPGPSSERNDDDQRREDHRPGGYGGRGSGRGGYGRGR